MIDSGSGINLIKQDCLNPEVPWEDNRKHSLQGISSLSVETLGSVLIPLMGKPTLFHVVTNSVGFVQNGILGNQFLQDHAASVNFKDKCLHYDDMRIPFTEINKIKIRGRSVTPFYVNVTNPEIVNGYVPLTIPAKGLYYGNAIVTNMNGKAYLPIINTTEIDYKLEIPSVELEGFDIVKTQEDFNGLNRVNDLGNDNNNVAVRDTASEFSGAVDSQDEQRICEINKNSNNAGTRGHTVDNLKMCKAATRERPARNNNNKSTRDSNIEYEDILKIKEGSLDNRDNVKKNTVIYLEPPVLDKRTTNNVSEKGHGLTRYISNPVYVMDRNDPPDKLEHGVAVVNLLRLDHLNPEEKDNIISLVMNHLDRFHLPHEKLEATNAVQHFIPTINEVPIHTKQYRYPPIHKEEIDKQVGRLLSDGLIECSSSPYNSPVWIVPKKPDSTGQKRWRMVIDYRNLNEKTIGDAYPLPNISDILDQLGSAKYFSVLDLASGFHQIPMAPKDAPKTAFSTPYGHYQFRRMPFGLKNAPATFQRLMDNVLSGLQGNELFVYMDDIVIYAKSLREHEIKFERLMKRLRNANLKLQPDKCEFLRQEVAYLGHIICSNGVRPDPDKIRSIAEFPHPKNQKNIKQFLGLAGYYRRFIPNFSKVAKPLTDLLKKDKLFAWQFQQEEAFNTLKSFLCSEPVLQYPDFSKSFNLTTDASGYAIGGVLSQGDIGKDLPIAYTSRTLSDAEQKYSTIEKECLAIVYCTNHFRPYLYGRKFIIITDHKPLIWLHSVKDPSSRLWKWRTKLAEYDYEIRYKAGLLNNNADALSRNPPVSTALPLRAIGESNDSSDESLFSAPDSRHRPREREISEVVKSPNLNRPVSGSSSPAPNVIITELNDDDDDSVEDFEQTFDSINEDDHQYEEIFDSNQVPYQKETQGPPNPSKISIIEVQDNLLTQNDNHVIFIHINGLPFDSGAWEYQRNNLLPRYENLTYERAHISPIKKKYVLISFPIKTNSHTRVEALTLDSCLQSLVDVVKELELSSFSINKTNNFDDLPWHYVMKRIRAHLQDINIRVTICKNLVQTPETNDREALIQENHSSAYGGHKGVTKTYNRLRTHYYWNTMKKDIQNFIQKCRHCQLKKLTRVKTKQPLIITDTPGAAFDKISMDIMGPLPITIEGNKYILTIQDLLTKYSVAVPLKEANAASIADAFTKKFLCIYGAPKALLTDQGANFLSSLMRNLTRRFNIQHFRTTAYHPQSNGSIERSHHVLMEYLKVHVDKEENWDQFIELAIFSYNTSVHEGTKYSPYELVFGRLVRLPSAHPKIEENTEITYQDYLNDLFNKLYEIQTIARSNLIQAKERSKYYYDRNLNPQKFKVGSYVYLLREPKKGKFSAQYKGPYPIVELLPHNNIKILLHDSPRIVHADKLKHAHMDSG